MIRFYLGHLENRQQLYRDFVRDVNNGKPCLLLVPEQFTVHAEQRLMQLRPQGLGGQAEVVSFKRLARRVMIACGRSLDRQPDGAVKAIVMMRAFMMLRDQLHFYAGARLTGGFIEQLCQVDEQMTRSCITPEQLEAKALEMGARQEKLSELALIVGQYRAMLEDRSFAGDEQEQAVELLAQEAVFAGYRIYVDGFYFFSAAEIELLGRLMSECEITFAFPAATDRAEIRQREVFARPRRTMAQLRRKARELGVSVQAIRIDEPTGDEALTYLRHHLFVQDAAPFEKDTLSIRLHKAVDSFDEAEYVAACVADLRYQGYCDGEIAVLCRNENDYKGVLDSVFDMHDISVFTDKRTSIQVKPLALLLTTALDIAAGEFTTEDVLTHIKTGLTPVNDTALGAMQRYCTIWEPLPTQWMKDFVDHPDGFTDKITEETTARLAAINEDRRRVIEPIDRITQAYKGTVGDVCRALYEYMEAIGVPKRLSAQTEQLDKQGDHAQAQECEQTWEIVGKALNALYEGAGDMAADADLFRQLFSCALGSFDIGRIPTSVDEVLTGRIDHVRTVAPRAVFVMGINSGIFPASTVDAQLINNGDREQLQAVGVTWEDGVQNGGDEWFYAYLGFTMPTERLYLSYHQLTDDHREAMAASEFFDRVHNLFPKVEISEGQVPIYDRAGAFDRLMSQGVRDASLKTYFEEHPEYRVRVKAALDAQSIGKADVAHSRVLESKIKNQGLSVSPTSLNMLVNCRFRYFCRYVLGLKPVERAQMDNREVGTLVHDMLEKVLKNYAQNNKNPIWEEDRNEVYRQADERMKQYLLAYFGGSERSARFRYLFDRICEVVHELLDRLCDEFAQSAFRVVAHELPIEFNNANAVEPIRVTFPGGSICIVGTIDRVDIMENDEGRFLRIVDYKTGGKDVNLDDMYNGMDVQMLLYLFSMMENGGPAYGLALRPAGVLYYPAKQQFYRVKAGTAPPDNAKMQEELAKQGAQNGLYLDDVKVLTAMEKDLRGWFIDSYIGRGDKLTGKRIPEHGFTVLKDHLIQLIGQLGQELLSGDVTPVPLIKGNKVECKYCDYASVCGFEPERGRIRRLEKYQGSELEKEVMGLVGNESQEDNTSD